MAIHVGNADLGPRGAEFLGNDARQRRADVLAHLCLGDKNMRGARAVNFIPKARGKGGIGAGGGEGFHRTPWRAPGQGEPQAHDAAAAYGAGEEATAGQIGFG